MKNYSHIAHTLREQIHHFSERFASRFNRPKVRFLEEMFYGIQASKDSKLSNIGRALEEKIPLKKTEERLSHHLEQKGMGQRINQQIAKMGADRIKKETSFPRARLCLVAWNPSKCGETSSAIFRMRIGSCCSTAD
jgi:hypothetical protein